MAERNNFARLSRDARRRVMYLLVNGATQDEIRNDPEVAAELDRRKLALHSTTFQAIERGEEYAEYKRSLEKTERQVAADRWAAEALRDCAGITSIADLTQLKLLEQLREFAEKGAGEPGDLLKLATAVTRIKAADSDERNARLSRQLEELKRLREAAEAEHRSREAELEAKLAEKDRRIAELEKLIPGVDSGRVADAMDEKFGV